MEDFDKRLIGKPKPVSDDELAILSNWYFGKPLHVDFDFYTESGSYKVIEKYNDYHGKGYEFGECCIHGYHHSRAFWNFVFGVLYCGGIASSSYGQFRANSERDKKRLMRWKDSRKANTGSGRIRKPFARLAEQLTGSERTTRF